MHEKQARIWKNTQIATQSRISEVQHKFRPGRVPHRVLDTEQYERRYDD